jgi:hypothetical protein
VVRGAPRSRSRGRIRGGGGVAAPGESAWLRSIPVEPFGSGGESAWMQPPFRCDYGTDTCLGRRVFFTFNNILDVCEVRTGVGAPTERR